MHEVYADNATIKLENGRTLNFEPREYHLGMARMYRSWQS